MNKISPVRFLLAPTSPLAAQLQQQARNHERAQLLGQQPVAPSISLAARIERGQLTVGAGRDWLATQPGLETAAPAMLLAALEDLLTRRARAAVPVAQGMPLPPVQQICGSGMIRISAKGVHVTGCSEPVLLEADGLPVWTLTAVHGEEPGRIFFSEGRWWLEATHASGS
mgnify:CR=1 FL=1